MSRLTRLGLFLVLLLTASQAVAITRTARQMNYLELFGGYSSAWGEYNGLPSLEFVDEDGLRYLADAGDIYDPTFHLGFTYGAIRSNFGWSVGFRYTRHNTEDTVFFSEDIFLPLDEPGFYFRLRQYDLDINLNYHFVDPSLQSFAPYLGIGLHPGITAAGYEGYDWENELTFAASLNFGADFVIFRDPNGRNSVAISSINSWNLLSTGDRAKYLNIGGGIRYFFKM